MKSFCIQLIKILSVLRTDFFSKKVENHLSEQINPLCRKILLSVLNGEDQHGEEFTLHQINPLNSISLTQMNAIHDFCLQEKPQHTLEIGFAYGASAMVFLSYHSLHPGGTHTAIDPGAANFWHGIGIKHTNTIIQSLGKPELFQLIEERSDRAFCPLQKQSKRFDLIFIDGCHLFDYALTDFFLYSQLLNENGVLILDDAWMPAVSSVANFIQKNRNDFQLISTPHNNLCIFRKVSVFDERPWHHFTRFSQLPMVKLK